MDAIIEGSKVDISNLAMASGGAPTLCRDWLDLAAHADKSKTHYLKIEEYSGWIRSRNCVDDNSYFDSNHYLSTHTFYNTSHRGSTLLLQKCGFNVIVDNWDDRLPEDLDTQKYLMELVAREQRLVKQQDDENIKRILFVNLGGDSIVGKNVKDYLQTTRIGSVSYKPLLHRIYAPSPKPAQGRNERCNCGSGKKFKKCCGSEV